MSVEPLIEPKKTTMPKPPVDRTPSEPDESPTIDPASPVGRGSYCFIDRDRAETNDWIQSLEAVLENQSSDRARFIVSRLIEHMFLRGVPLPFSANTPYTNTIPRAKQPPYPGDRNIERRIKSLVRWNAMAMVVRANRKCDGIGGHISTFASSASLYEVGFNHFFHGKSGDSSGDQIFFQGHASPGIYSRAFLEGRISEKQCQNFRRELEAGGGLPSYPHPWLAPSFWEFPTVSMGLASIDAIYQARFNRYLQDRGLCDTQGSRVWCFMGDGETDEPESLGAITLAARENLDNLTFVINCNLQRLDGPVRGNGQIIQELEAAFRGAGWNCIKVIWGDDWDPLFENDKDHLLVQAADNLIDGWSQKYVVAPGSFTREHFFNSIPGLLKLVEHMSDDEIMNLKRGGHDPAKVYSAYKKAVEYTEGPTVVLAKTVKGYGLGEAGEGRNVTHNQKKLNDEELREFRDRFDIPIADKELADAPFYRPPEDSEEIQYMLERRRELGGPVPNRVVRPKQVVVPDRDYLAEFYAGSDGREASTTMVFVRMLAQLLNHKETGKYIVPIVPDEARTFGMEGMFRKAGIYSHTGQLYDPVDSHLLLYYREARDGQILEEGITEAGSMASFLAASTAYATHGRPMIPFFIYYSMFGFQRIGDQIWLCGDMRGRGFLLGGTAGRTTLNGEGLQHQDGHSHILASTVPNVQAYDPAFAYELAVILQDGIRRMYGENEDVFYYVTIYNENYVQPPMPKGVEDGILRGMYKYRAAEKPGKKPRVHLFGSGTILREALRAQEILDERFNVAADVWSVTSYKELRRDALAVERENMLNAHRKPQKCYVEKQLEKEPWPIVAASDYLKLLPDMIQRWVPNGMTSLGTDGYGRSESRPTLRRHFEVDAEHICLAAMYQLVQRGEAKPADVKKLVKELGLDQDKQDPYLM
ncbi:MAG: pyruvate dehydrogenase E1 component [Phycisphaerae bacterium]|nr:MAG: pyruvate dehydrogenase E1 component [Phycisphaerae bacterium]